MANTIQLKRRPSGNSGAPVSLLSGEPAHNEVDDTLYIGKGDDGGGNATSIVALAGKGAFVDKDTAQTVGGKKTFSSVPAASEDATGATDLVRKSQMDTLLAAKSSTGHQHAISDVTSLQSTLNGKAPLASPALTGAPTAPTAAGGTNTTQIATTAFVQAEITAYSVSALADIADVVISTPADNELLAFDQTSGNWINQTPAEAGVAAAVHTHSAADIVSGTLPVARGGTGGGTASAARTALGVAIGADVQAHSAVLDATTASFTTADETKLDHISVTQAVDLDDLDARVNSLDAAIVLKGTWDASGGSFPGGGSAQAGESWIVSVGGTVDGVAFTANDRLIATADNASTATYAGNWHKADYTDQVQSVAGKTGAVTLAAGDIASGTMADARIAASNVTQHQAALSITESQISDLGSYLTGIGGEALGDLGDVTITSVATGEVLAWNGSAWINRTLGEAGIAATGHGHAAGDISSGTMADARIAASNVTQHQAALSVTLSQVSDSGTMAAQDASAVSITGGTIDGCTIDGGTF